MTNFRWIICGLLFLATTINYLNRQVLSLTWKDFIALDFHWNDNDYGNITAVFSILYAITSLFAGKFIDWIGSKKGYIWAIVIWSIGSCLQSACGWITMKLAGISNIEELRNVTKDSEKASKVSAISIGFFLTFLIVLAIGEAGNFPAAIKVTAEYFPKKDRAYATSLFNTGASVGALIAPLIIPLIAKKLNWEMAFLIVGSIGFFWAGLWLFFYSPPAKSKYVSKEELAYIESDRDIENVKKIENGEKIEDSEKIEDVKKIKNSKKVENEVKDEDPGKIREPEKIDNNKITDITESIDISEKKIENVEKMKIQNFDKNINENEPKFSILDCFKHRQTWAFIVGKLMTDGVWWFFLFWAPAYFSELGYPTSSGKGRLLIFVLYFIVTIVSIFGGYLPKFFVEKIKMEPYIGRMRAMLIFAFLPVFAIVAQPLADKSEWWPSIIIGLAGAGHQAWSANLFSTIGDMFPKSAIATITGIGTMFGGLCSFAINKCSGMLFTYAEDQGRSFHFFGNIGKSAAYMMIFCYCAFAYLLAWCIMKVLVPKYKPVC